jgi:F0F1-type ATP synthase assembly protein I
MTYDRRHVVADRTPVNYESVRRLRTDLRAKANAAHRDATKEKDAAKKAELIGMAKAYETAADLMGERLVG